MTDVFEEVEEQIRQDRYVAFFKRWGLWLAVGFVLLLAGMGAGLAWRHYAEEGRRANSDAFAAILTDLQEGRLEEAKTGLAAFEGRDEGVYRAFTLMTEAAISVQEGDLTGAVDKFDAAAEASRNPLVRDSARLRAAYIVADTQDFAALETRLEPLIGEDAAPEIRAAALELLAIEAWEAGDIQRARDVFDQLTLDVSTPEAIRQRASVMAPAVLGPEPAPAAVPAAENPAEAATAEEGATQ